MCSVGILYTMRMLRSRPVEFVTQLKIQNTFCVSLIS